jgi:hypothetical protein
MASNDAIRTTMINLTPTPAGFRRMHEAFASEEKAARERSRRAASLMEKV